MNVIERFKQGRQVHTKLPDNKTAGNRNVGEFVKLEGEAFWRRVNSDGTLTKVEDGQAGTIDYRDNNVPKKVKKNTSWRIALANSVDPIWGYPPDISSSYDIYKGVKDKQKSQDINIPNYEVLPSLEDSVSHAAWRKYLGLSYDPKFLPIGVPDDRTNYGTNTVRLPRQLEEEIPTDTTFIKNRILRNEAYLNNGLPKPDENIEIVRKSIDHDTKALNALRYTYSTGKPIGMYEGTYNSRQLINNGIVDQDGITHSPLNVFQNYNIRYDKDTNRMYYSKEYDFDNAVSWPLKVIGYDGMDDFLEGQPFRFRGYIDLNK